MGLQKQCRERERKRTRACFGYVSLFCDIIDKEPSNYEEAIERKEWKDAIRSVLALAAVMKWKIHQMDAKNAFLNPVVEEELYVEHPLGFETHDKETHV